MEQGAIGSLVERRIEERYEGLRALAASPPKWIRTRIGADLWVDGLTAFQKTSQPSFALLLRRFITKGAITAEQDWQDLPAILNNWDRFARETAVQASATFWPHLALGMSLVHAAGGLPRIHRGNAVVVNDTLLTLLSPFYRALRFGAFNKGHVFQVFEQAPRASFVPEAGFFAVFPPYLVQRLSPPRLQQYSMSHELVHLAFFSDAYRIPVGRQETTAAMLLNLEEVALGADLRFVSELSMWGRTLHHDAEYDKTQNGWQPKVGCPDGPFAHLRRDPRVAGRYAAGLKSRAQRFADDAAIARLCSRPEPPGLSRWVSDGTLRRHAKWHTSKAQMIHRPAYRQIVDLWPPESTSLGNSSRFIRGSLLDVGPLEVPRPDQVARRVARMRFSLALLQVRLAELRANDEEGRSHGLPASEDLDSLAMKIAIEGVGFSSTRSWQASEIRRVQSRVAALQRSAFALVEKDGHGNREALLASLVDPSSPAPRGGA